MEVYICDSDFQTIDILDTVVSVIWTERYNTGGDVTIVAPLNDKNLKLLKEFAFVSMDSSDEIMMLETISIENQLITAKGSGLLEFLKQRFFRDRWQDSQGWVVTEQQMYKIINSILVMAVNPATSMINSVVLRPEQGAQEVVDDFIISTDIPKGFNDVFSMTIPYNDVYTVITTLANLDNLGLRLVPNRLGPGMKFSMYRGLDRTSTQKENAVMLLDPAMKNLTDVKTLRSIEGYKNVCWVWPSGITSQTHIGVAYVDGAQNLDRFKHRTMTLTASDIKATDYGGAVLQLMLAAAGRNALINNNYVRLVDGQMVIKDGYIFGTDYGMGDIVELRSLGGEISSAAQVTEYIRARDDKGESAYPTLSVI